MSSSSMTLKDVTYLCIIEKYDMMNYYLAHGHTFENNLKPEYAICVRNNLKKNRNNIRNLLQCFQILPDDVLSIIEEYMVLDTNNLDLSSEYDGNPRDIFNRELKAYELKDMFMA